MQDITVLTGMWLRKLSSGDFSGCLELLFKVVYCDPQVFHGLDFNCKFDFMLILLNHQECGKKAA